MNYILIEEKAWTELLAAAKRMKEKVETLEHHFNPIELEGWIDNKAVCLWLGISKRTLQYFRESGALPYTVIGNKCYYNAEGVKMLLDKKSKLWKKKK